MKTNINIHTDKWKEARKVVFARYKKLATYYTQI